MNEYRKLVENLIEKDPLKVYQVSHNNLYASAISTISIEFELSYEDAEKVLVKGLLNIDTVSGKGLSLRIMIDWYRKLLGLTYSSRITFYNDYLVLEAGYDLNSKAERGKKLSRVKKFITIQSYVFDTIGMFIPLSTIDFDNISENSILHGIKLYLEQEIRI